MSSAKSHGIYTEVKGSKVAHYNVRSLAHIH